MVNLVEHMLRDGILKKEDIAKLVRMRPPKKITLDNIILENILNKNIVQTYLAKKVRQGDITLLDVENIFGIDTTFVLKQIASSLKIEYIDIDDIEVDMSLFSKISYQQLVKHNVLPVEENDLNIVVIFEDPLDMAAKDAIQRLFPHKPIAVTLASPKKVKIYLQRLETSQSIKSLIDEVRRDLNDGGNEKNDGESPAVLKLIDLILRDSVTLRASDIHIEATEKNCLIRARVDGMLIQSFVFDRDIFSPLSSRMKLLSNLDIAEKRKPQDGRFSAKVLGKDFDFRVSTLPTIFGESIVMRILDKSKVMIKLEDAGMSEFCYSKFSDSIKAPYGIVLVTGPTGSGKTTTLYGALNAIKNVKDKIITVEDPVEYQMAGIQQVQVRSNIGLSFSDALRSILRQDPDKIMIGEIRDTETLRIAIQAALTGHLVLSTLHTNDSISAVTRILDMGIESYLVSGALVAIQAQRLVRKICPYCKSTSVLPEKILLDFKKYLPDDYTFYKGSGCSECQHTGYFGREMISEVLTLSDTMSRMIASGESKELLSKQALEEGFISMLQDGVNKALEGKTTIDEILRVARL